jgi:lipopolysaccharide transport system permease protein
MGVRFYGSCPASNHRRRLLDVLGGSEFGLLIAISSLPDAFGRMLEHRRSISESLAAETRARFVREVFHGSRASGAGQNGRSRMTLENGSTELPELILEPGGADRHYWIDLWRYRELFQVLAWRDVSVRYKQTVIGVLWALLRPFLTMVVLTIIFGKVADLPSDGGAPYALMVYAGMLPWTFFSTALSDASNSMLGSSSLITKVYFPRMIIPAAAVVVALVDFLISFVIMLPLMVWYEFMPGWQILLLPVFIALAFVASLGPALWITSLNVKYRDFRFMIPFLIQFGLYVSPVGFSSSVVPEKWRLLYSLNPIVGVIDGFRWSILGGESQIYWPGFAASLIVIVLFMRLGVFHFRKMERSFADLI